jgi:acetate kinase
MNPYILTINAGSSSLKFALYEARDSALAELARGQVEGIGEEPRFKLRTPQGEVLAEESLAGDDAPRDASTALKWILARQRRQNPGLHIDAIGHRVVHGGPSFDEPIVIDDATIAQLEAFVPLTPLHQPHNLAGIAAARAAFPNALQVACFDTAFHRSHPWVNDVFALPLELYDMGVRRYGFHGLSYEYIMRELRDRAPLHAAGRVIVAHLGNGASMSAIRDGQSVGSSMGFSALDGLPMGTRCGQIDPGVLLYLMTSEGMSVEDLTELLFKRSGLAGLSGISHDMRVLQKSDRPEAARAIEYFVFRVRRELGAMAAVLGGVDALVFTGGVGENANQIRERICSGLEWLGIELDQHRNGMSASVVSSDRSRCRVFVIRTNEELVIASHTLSKLETESSRTAVAG